MSHQSAPGADTNRHLAEFIKHAALETGFDACGIAKAERLEEDVPRLHRWLQRGMHGEMGYMERNIEKRTDPRLLAEECRSVVVTLTNYYPTRRQPANAPRISKYAYAREDYHTVIKRQLLALECKITAQFGADCFPTGRQHRFVDSAPVLERRWAERAGLGWIGKNKMLINPTLGSFCFIGILLLNRETDYDTPIPSRCGRCTKCLEACPTQALSIEHGLDATRCIAYQTIEKRGAISPDVRNRLAGYVFGCDICNDVCPWNKTRAKPTANKAFDPPDEIINWTETEWTAMTQTEFDRTFSQSAICRAGFGKLKENLRHRQANEPPR